jgi:hypothetical protein
VFKNSLEAVVQELSSILEFIINQAIRDMNVVLARETGVSPVPTGQTDSARIKEIEQFRSGGGE